MPGTRALPRSMPAPLSIVQSWTAIKMVWPARIPHSAASPHTSRSILISSAPGRSPAFVRVLVLFAAAEAPVVVPRFPFHPLLTWPGCVQGLPRKTTPKYPDLYPESQCELGFYTFSRLVAALTLRLDSPHDAPTDDFHPPQPKPFHKPVRTLLQQVCHRLAADYRTTSISPRQ